MKSTVSELLRSKQRASHLLHVIYTATHKSELLEAFKELYQLATGSDFTGIFVFEMGRFIVTTRDMQKIKEKHAKTRRWTYVKPLYSMLYKDLYVDLDPESGVMSNGELEDI